jgi:hypothetical protein
VEKEIKRKKGRKINKRKIPQKKRKKGIQTTKERKKKLSHLYGDTERKSVARKDAWEGSTTATCSERGPGSFCRLASCLVGGRLRSDWSDQMISRHRVS